MITKITPYCISVGLLLTSLFCRAQAQDILGAPPLNTYVHCPPAEIVRPQQDNLVRSENALDTWEFALVPLGDVIISDRKWKYPGKGYADITGGTWILNENDPNQLLWESVNLGVLTELKVGKFAVSVSARRRCGGGGVGGNGLPLEDTFESDWGGDVIGAGAYRNTGEITLVGKIGSSGTSPPDGSKVFPGQKVKLQLAFSDPDQNKPAGETEWKAFLAPPAWAHYAVSISLLNAKFADGTANRPVSSESFGPGSFGILNLDLTISPVIPDNQFVGVFISIQDRTSIPEKYLQTGKSNDLKDELKTLNLIWTKATSAPTTIEAMWQSPPGIKLGKAGVGTEQDRAATEGDIVVVSHRFGPDLNGAQEGPNYEGIAVQEIFPPQDDTTPPGTNYVTTNISSNWIKPDVRDAFPNNATPAQIFSRRIASQSVTSTFVIGPTDEILDSFAGGYALFDSLLTPEALEQPLLYYESTQEYRCPPSTVLAGGVFKLRYSRLRDANGKITYKFRRYPS